MNMKKISCVLVFFLCLFATEFLRSSAQQSQPQFFITWRAQNYAPTNYSGKILPVANSSVTASFEVLDPLTGKFIDLATAIIDPDTGKLTTRAAYKAKLDRMNKTLLDSIGSEDQLVPADLPPLPTINWYVNNRLIKTSGGGEPGSQTVSFRTPALGGRNELKIQLSDFALNGPFFNVVNIPVVRPEVVIEAPLPNNQFSGPSVAARATPYFFNIINPFELTYSWNVNDQTPPNAENPAELTVTVNPEAPSGSGINISVSVENPKIKLEAAIAFLDLIYLK